MCILGYSDVGDPVFIYNFCNALFWYGERRRKNVKSLNPTYSLCCYSGKIRIPIIKEPPQAIQNLLFFYHPHGKHFRENIRSFNSMFSFTSMGGKIDKSLNNGSAPPVFRLCGQNYHRIGSLMPDEGDTPKFAQLYIYDTQNEISNRICSVR